MNLQLFAATLSLCTLAGCASVEAILPPDAKIEANFGYVACLSYSTTAKNFSVVIENSVTGARYGVPLGASISTLPILVDKMTAIKVAPGSYQIVGWANGAGVRAWDRQPGQSSPLSQPFTVKAGAVVALGRFVVDSNYLDKYIYVYSYNAIRSSRVSRGELRDAFHETYGSMNETSFSCVLCSD